MRSDRGAEEEGREKERVSVELRADRKRREGRREKERRLTIVSGHHDLDELNDLSSLELGILEKRIKLVSGRDLVELLGVWELVGRGSRGEEVEEEGVVVGLDVVVDGGNPVDLRGDAKKRKKEKRKSQRRVENEKERIEGEWNEPVAQSRNRRC